MSLDSSGQLWHPEDLVQIKQFYLGLVGTLEQGQHLVVFRAAGGYDQQLASDGYSLQPVYQQEKAVAKALQELRSSGVQVELARAEAAPTLEFGQVAPPRLLQQEVGL